MRRATVLDFCKFFTYSDDTIPVLIKCGVDKVASSDSVYKAAAELPPHILVMIVRYVALSKDELVIEVR